MCLDIKIRASFPGNYAAEHDAVHLPQYDAIVTNVWTIIPIKLHIVALN